MRELDIVQRDLLIEIKKANNLEELRSLLHKIEDSDLPDKEGLIGAIGMRMDDLDI